MKKITMSFIVLMMLVNDVGSPILINRNIHIFEKIQTYKGGMKKFLLVLSNRESANRDWVTSKNGHLGMYQFSPKTLKWIGYNITDDEFLNSPSTQDEAMIRYLKINKKILRKIISKWSDTEINGKIITESGILAASHLVGPGGVKDYFNFNINTQDGNGIKITDYLFKYSGYDLRM
jgi:hypothetical protein